MTKIKNVLIQFFFIRAITWPRAIAYWPRAIAYWPRAIAFWPRAIALGYIVISSLSAKDIVYLKDDTFVEGKIIRTGRFEVEIIDADTQKKELIQKSDIQRIARDKDKQKRKALRQAKLRQKFHLSVLAGVGFSNGSTTYQIGGNFTDYSGVTEKSHFPISELDFGTKQYLVRLGLEFSFLDKLFVTAIFERDIPYFENKFTDSDWGVSNSVASNQVKQLDIYATSSLDIEHLQTSFRLAYYQSLGDNFQILPLVGFKYRYYSFVAKDATVTYPSSPNKLGFQKDPVSLKGEVLKYKAWYNLPYLGFGLKGNISEYFSLEVSVGFIINSTVKDEDDHILRNRIATSTNFGSGFIFNSVFTYQLNSRVAFKTSFEYIKTSAEGRQTQVMYGDDSVNNLVKGQTAIIDSKMFSEDYTVDFTVQLMIF